MPGIWSALSGGQLADFNHFYRTEQAEIVPAGVAMDAALACDGPHCAAFLPGRLARRPHPRQPCGPGVTVGMLDTA